MQADIYTIAQGGLQDLLFLLLAMPMLLLHQQVAPLISDTWFEGSSSNCLSAPDRQFSKNVWRPGPLII